MSAQGEAVGRGAAADARAALARARSALAAQRDGIGHLDDAEASDPTTEAINRVGSHALHIMEVAIGHRTKAIEGGFPAQIADAMGYGLWSLMTQQAFRGGGS